MPPNLATEYVRVSNLSKSYAVEQALLRNVSFSLRQGEMVAMMGRSGSGKTTLLNIIGGLDREYSGTVRVNGHRLEDFTDRQLSAYRNQNIGFVFQSFHLLAHLSCLENVCLPGHFSPNCNHAQRIERAHTLLASMDIADKKNQTPNLLSGGQKQRVAIARALFNQPHLLICDEPTGSLDQHAANDIIRLLTQLNQEHQVTVLVVTHDPKVAEATQRVIVIEEGGVQ